VTGLALACLFFSSAILRTVFRFQGEGYEWGIYLTLGTIFPFLLLLLSLPNRFSEASKKSKSVLAFLCLPLFVLFILQRPHYSIVALSVVHLALLARFQKGIHETARWIVLFLVIVTAWSVASTLMWWSSFDEWFLIDGRFETIYRFVVCALSLLLVFVNVDVFQKPGEAARVRARSFADLVAILIIGFASVRSDQLFNTMSYSHWGVVVGPAEMVRQGGWLLWDVPSQYGFLNVMLVALLPFKSTWQSAYVLNSVLLFVSAIILFFILRSLQPGPKNFVFSLAVTLAAAFLITGWPPALLGPQVFPSLGPFRFIWCYILLVILLWHFKTSRQQDWRVLVAGTIAWVVGTLWSSESAVYCFAIWMPAYLLIVMQRADGIEEQERMRRERWLVTTRWLIFPALLCAAMVALISIYYRLRLGWWPDWAAFYEYSFAFAGGFFAVPVDPAGPVWALFLVFAVLSTAAAYLISDFKQWNSASLIAGAWGALWAVSSYFVSRSHPNNATVLTPLFCTVIATTLLLLAKYELHGWWQRLVRASLVPLLTIILTVTFGNAGFLGLYLSSPKIGYEKNIESHLPVLDASLRDLFQAANVHTTDPIVYSAVRVKSVEPLADGLTHDHGVLLPAWPQQGNEVFCCARAWLPSTPFVLMVPLSEHRRQEYMARFIARVRTGGWLVQNKKEAPYTSSTWFHSQLTKTHVPARVFENDNWQLIWFELRMPEKPL